LLQPAKLSFFYELVRNLLKEYFLG
jgi:hypothetical protein